MVMSKQRYNSKSKDRIQSNMQPGATSANSEQQNVQFLSAVSVNNLKNNFY
jgi:hypothetical protein